MGDRARKHEQRNWQHVSLPTLQAGAVPSLSPWATTLSPVPRLPPAQPSSLRCLVWNDPKQPALFQFSQCRAETAPPTNTIPVALSLMWPKRAFFPSKCSLMGRSCSAFLLVNYTQTGRRCLPVSGCPEWDLEPSKRDHSSFTSRLFLPSYF